MTVFEMIKYHDQEYPADIPLRTEEVAAHFDVEKLAGSMNRSLHTEYSYGKRNWVSAALNRYSEITAARKDGVPQLWKNETWATQFADYIVDLNGNHPAPIMIEVHSFCISYK